MTSPQSEPFSQLLKRYRVAAGLTQEALAERAGLAVRSISDMERGLRRTPYRDSVSKLIEALQLSAVERTQFEAATRRRGTPYTKISSESPTDMLLTSSEREPEDTQSPETAAPLVATSIGVPAEMGVEQRPRGAARAAFRLAREHAVQLISANTAVRVPGTPVTWLTSMLLVGVLLGGALLSTDAMGPRAPTGGTLCLATEFPLAGENEPGDKGAWAVTLEHAVQLAVQQNQSLGNGYTLKVIHYSETLDTTAQQDPQQAAKNVTEMVQTPCILGMVGPVASRVAAVEMPITARAGLAMVSPANTMPGLTLRLYAADNELNFDQLHPAGEQTNYFRIIVNDAFQGRELADLASRQPPAGLGARSAFVVDDHTAYGEELTSGFIQDFLAQGGTIAGTDGIPFGGAARIAELAARIVAARPDVVCYGGAVDGGGGLLKAQLAQAGYTGVFVGGDGIAQDPAFINQAGVAASRDVYAITPVPDSAQLTLGAAAKFVHDFNTSYPGEALDGYGANAYDAAMILITAMKSLIRAGKNVTRQTVLDQLQGIQYAGVTGHISFDHNGDNAYGVFSLYTVQDGDWVWVKQDTV